jgi:hypothetical protein
LLAGGAPTGAVTLVAADPAEGGGGGIADGVTGPADSGGAGNTELVGGAPPAADASLFDLARASSFSHFWRRDACFSAMDDCCCEYS